MTAAVVAIWQWRRHMVKRRRCGAARTKPAGEQEMPTLVACAGVTMSPRRGPPSLPVLPTCLPLDQNALSLRPLPSCITCTLTSFIGSLRRLPSVGQLLRFFWDGQHRQDMGSRYTAHPAGECPKRGGDLGKWPVFSFSQLLVNKLCK